MSETYVSAALRRLVVERAAGCCEYCLIPAELAFLPHEIDHIIAEKHGGTTEPDNLSLSCVVCNKRKGSDIASLDPLSGETTPLYHPRRDRRHEHLILLPDGQFSGTSAVGRTTINFLRLNNPQRISERLALLRAGVLVAK